ncbi:MAG TPA: hypothetical protein PKD67_09970 [Ignavibacteriaceae bacterium]|nr:hypothetical protein [Ignavibacteriaceae bacterium]
MPIKPKETIEFLTNAFLPYNTIDLIIKLSALRLLPANGENTIRLDLLLHVASSLSNFNGPKITRKKLFSLINSRIVKESFFKQQEDPSTNIFCEELSFYGGGYRVFPGCYSNITYQLKNTFYALFKNGEHNLSEELRKELESSILFILNLSEAIALRADINRNVDVKYSNEIFIPSEKELFNLMLCNIYKDSELQALANDFNINFNSLSWLFTKLNKSIIKSYKIDSGVLISAPIITHNGYNIVTDPSSLLNALRNKILDVIYTNNLVDKFNESYISTVWENTRESLFRLGFYQKTYIEATKAHNDPFIFDTFKFDEDKLAFVILLFDDRKNERNSTVKVTLSDYRPKFDWVINLINSTEKAPNDLFFLFVTSNYERTILFEASFPEYKSLMLSAENLECISYLEAGKELFLYKFSIARNQTTQVIRLISFDKLSEYSLFKKYNSSFYLMDDGVPFYTIVSDDHSRSARMEMKIHTDIHAVYNPLKKAYVDIILLHEMDFPFYAPVYYPHNSEFLIESYSIPIWLYSKHLESYSNHSFRRLVIEMLDNLAYWIIELKPSLEKHLDGKQISEYLLIEVLFDEEVEWDNLSSNVIQTSRDAFSLTIKLPNTITFLFGKGLNRILATSDNSGEREIISSLLKTVPKLFDDDQLKQELSETRVEEIINKHMPLGKKKKMGVYDTSKVPELNPLEISKPRVLDEIITNLLLDDLGRYILENKLIVGEKREDYYKFIKDYVVPFFLEKLTNDLKKYDKQTLFNYLIQQNESLTYERILHEIQLPMRIEIANKDTVLEDFKSTYSKIVQSSPACRFLIEYSLGMEICGIKQISNYDYEFLLSLANEIIHWGFIGDLIRFNITDLRLSVLKSNRLYVESKDYDKAYSVFSNQITDYNINKFNSEFSKYWEVKKNNPDAKDDESFQEFNKEFKEEFGYSLNDLIEFERKIFKYSNEKNTTIMTIEENEFKKLYVGTISPDSLGNILFQWSIMDRENFFEVPNSKFEPYDFFPWRFNRLYSYVRRPILIMESDGKLYYKIGLRHLKIAVDNFTTLLRNNRLVNKLNNQKLKKILTEFASFSNINFVKKVKAIFEKESYFVSNVNVKKIGKNRIVAENGNDMGDIDVLVIDKKRHEILFIECKDLLLSRTPYEMHSEITKVFTSSNSQMQRHLLRLEWGIKNIDLFLQQFNLEKKYNWKIKGYFVSSIPLFSPLVKPMKNIGYFTFEDFKKKYTCN